MANIKLKRNIICVILFFWTCIPSSINTTFSISIGNTCFRLNIIIGLLGNAFLWLLNLKKGKVFVIDSHNLYFVLALIISAIVSSFICIFNEELQISSLFEALLVCFLPYSLLLNFEKIEKEKEKEEIISFFIFLGVLISFQSVFFLFVYRFINSQYILDDRPFTSMGGATGTAIFIFVAVVVTFISYITKQKKIYLVFILFELLSMLILETRSALLMTCCFFFIVAIRSRWNKKIKIVLVFLLFTIVVLSLRPDLFDKVYNRFFTIQSKNSNETRLLYMKEGIDKFLQSPIVGNGLGLLVDRIARIRNYSSDINGTHNQWIAFLAEQGLVGFILFFLYTVKFFNRKNDSAFSEEIIYAKAGLFCIVFIGFMFEVLLSGDIRSGIEYWIFPMLMNYYETKSDKIDNC